MPCGPSIAPRLLHVIKALAEDFAPLQEPVIVPELAAKQGVPRGPDWEAAQNIRRRLMARVLYLTQRLLMLAALPDEVVVPGVPAATLAQVLPLAETLLRLDRIQGTSWPEPRIDSQRTFANPRGVLPDTASYPLWDRAFADLGAQAAGRAADLPRDQTCPHAPVDSTNALPNAYWRGYWVSALTTGSQRCMPQRETGWVTANIRSSKADDPGLAARRMNGARHLTRLNMAPPERPPASATKISRDNVSGSSITLRFRVPVALTRGQVNLSAYRNC